nr:polysaccharide deacetylase family protein [Nocardia brasiliensis]
MNRRRLLLALAAGAVGSISSGGSRNNTRSTALTAGSVATPVPSSTLQPQPTGSRPTLSPRVPIPAGPVTAIPGTGYNLALTVDDGASSEVVGAYIQFAKDTGARFTFFVTAAYQSWTDHKRQLRPLVDSGQIQLGNHTWDHPDLTTLTHEQISTQFARSKSFLRNTFGVDGTPFYRPPYAYRDKRVDSIAADHGYTVPLMWYGSLEDWHVITTDYLLDCARRYFQPQAIVIGHANHLPVTQVYSQLIDILKERQLSLVTLNDVFRH